MFWTRLFSGIVLLAIAITAICLGGDILLYGLLLVSLIAYKELTNALQVNTKQKQFQALEVIGIAGIVIYYLLMGLDADPMKLLAAMMGLFLALMFGYVFTFPKFQSGQVLAAYGAFVYAPVMLSFIYMTREQLGIYVVWLIFISSWGSDTCAYVVGILLGKHKIFPKLSPKKSLEGCIGGVVGSGLIGGIYGYFLWKFEVYSQFDSVYRIAVVCAIGAVLSMVGDLAASAIKRQNGIKDYGNLIPGHGGIMDRFDSTIVTAPIVFFLCSIMLQV